MRMSTIAGFLVGAVLAIGPAHADRIEAVAECAPTGETLEYRCIYRLSAGGAPLEGAVFTMKPDMPSMPMAHNIPPVPVEPTDEPSVYAATFRLDMHGRWSMRLDFTAPGRDVVVLHEEFEPTDGAAHHGHGQGHGHGHNHQNPDKPDGHDRRSDAGGSGRYLVALGH